MEVTVLTSFYKVLSREVTEYLMGPDKSVLS